MGISGIATDPTIVKDDVTTAWMRKEEGWALHCIPAFQDVGYMTSGSYTAFCILSQCIAWCLMKVFSVGSDLCDKCVCCGNRICDSQVLEMSRKLSALNPQPGRNMIQP